MSKTFKAYINKNNIGFTIQPYENNIALGMPVSFPSKACAMPEHRQFLYEDIERIKDIMKKILQLSWHTQIFNICL